MLIEVLSLQLFLAVNWALADIKLRHQCCTLASNFEHTPISRHSDVIHKAEVHYVSQHYQKRT